METRQIVGTLTTYTWRPEGQVFVVREGKNFIGSGYVSSVPIHRQCDIYIPEDSRLSSEHAVILCRSGRCEIIGQKSDNGTFLNGEIVPLQGKELPNYAEIQTGSTVWTFVKFVPTMTSIHDVFISHATEDKDFAEPLARELVSLAVNVWYDRFVLKVGDSLRESIDKGLVSARFGIVVLSKSFFNKRWPQYELNGLMARENKGRKVILPIWYELSHNEVVRYSPSLADKVALSYPQQTLHEIARILADIMREP